MSTTFLVRAWADHITEEKDKLSFQKGDAFWCYQEDGGTGWAVGEFNGKHGWFPFSHVKREEHKEVAASTSPGASHSGWTSGKKQTSSDSDKVSAALSPRAGAPLIKVTLRYDASQVLCPGEKDVFNPGTLQPSSPSSSSSSPSSFKFITTTFEIAQTSTSYEICKVATAHLGLRDPSAFSLYTYPLTELPEAISDDARPFTSGTADLAILRRTEFQNSPFGKGQTVALNKMLTYNYFSDLTLVVKGEEVSAHTAIVSQQCIDIFPLKIKKQLAKKKKLKKTIVDLKDLYPSANLISYLLTYLYTEEVNLEKLPPKGVVELISMASRLNQERLVWLCEAYLEKTLDEETVLIVLAEAAKLKVYKLKDLCIKVAIPFFPKFKDKARAELGGPLFSDLEKAATGGSSSFNFSLGKPPKSTIRAQFCCLYQQAELTGDCIAMVGNSKIRFHKALLAGHSPKLKQMVETAGSETSIRIDSLSEGAFKALLRHLYYEDTIIYPPYACELLAFSKEYQLPILTAVAKERVWNGFAGNTVVSILRRSAQETKDQDMVSITQAVIEWIIKNIDKVDLAGASQLTHHTVLSLVYGYQKTKMPETPEEHPKTPRGASFSTKSSYSSSGASKSSSSSASSASASSSSSAAASSSSSTPSLPPLGSTITAIADYTSTAQGTLSFSKGTTLTFCQPPNPGTPWAVGELAGQRGWIPISYFSWS